MFNQSTTVQYQWLNLLMKVKNMKRTIKLLIVCISCIGYGILWTLTFPKIGVLPVWVIYASLPYALFLGVLLSNLKK